MGSGYGTSLAREAVDPDGLVVAIEIDAATLAFARENLNRAGYSDIVLIRGDGGLGHSEHAPYDRICVTAAWPDVPSPLIEHLAMPGRLSRPSSKPRGSDSRCSRRPRTAFAARASRTCCTCRSGDGTALAAMPGTDAGR